MHIHHAVQTQGENNWEDVLERQNTCSKWEVESERATEHVQKTIYKSGNSIVNYITVSKWNEYRDRLHNTVFR